MGRRKKKTILHSLRPWQAAWTGKHKQQSNKQARDLPTIMRASLWDSIVALLEEKMGDKINSLLSLLTPGGGQENKSQKRPRQACKACMNQATRAVSPGTVGASACTEPTAPTQPNPTQPNPSRSITSEKLKIAENLAVGIFFGFTS